MSIQPAPTPNPNAMKYGVGQPVGGPATYVAGKDVDNKMAEDLLAVEGVASIFMTADFITVTKSADASWDDITPEAVEILGNHFSD